MNTKAELNWLDQFQSRDRHLMESLLERLEWVSASQYEQAVSRALLDLAHKHSAPIAAYAIRPCDGTYFQNKRNRPQPVPIGPGVLHQGSEYATANLISRLRRQEPRILDHTPIGNLRKGRIRHIAVVDDILGSGRRASKFVRAWLSEPTTRSWWSGGLLRIHLVAFASSGQAMDRLRHDLTRNKSSRYANYIELVSERSLDAWLADKDTEPTRRLLSRHAKRFNLKYPLGFENSLVGTIFEHGCPNNAPGCLWESTSTWKPLFPNRAISPPLLDERFGGESQAAAEHRRFEDLLGFRVPVGLQLSARDRADRDLALVVAARSHGLRRPDRIANATTLSLTRVKAAIALGVKRGWMDSTGALSDQGRQEVAAAKRLLRHYPQSQLLTFAPYFPKSLRAG